MANTPAASPTHPDVAGLAKAGMPPERTTALASAHGVSHPAVPTAKEANTNPVAQPGPTDYAAMVLSDAGLPVTADNENLLKIQMTMEGMPGSENNPLATTVKGPGSSTVNSAGVQEFPTLGEGEQAEAQTLKQSNMASIYKALMGGNDTDQQYAAALAGSAYEGYNPAANAAYANSFLKDSGNPEQSFPGGSAPASSGSSGTPSYGTADLSAAMGTDPFASLSGIIPTLGTQSSNYALQQALSGLSAPASTALLANTSQAPGSADQTPSVAQQTAVNPAATYQSQLAQLLPNIRPGAAQ